MPTAKLFLDPTLSNAAGPYYSLFPVEPTPSGSSGDWLTVDRRQVTSLKSEKLDELLERIAATAPANGNVLITGHGNDQGLRFFIGDPKKDVHLEFSNIERIRRNQEGKESDAETAKFLALKPEEFAKLKQQIEKVQHLSLARVDVRACNTGQNDVTMSALQVFFNCDTFCAPKLLDSFGAIKFKPFAKDAADFDKWLANHKAATVSGTSPDRFGLLMSMYGAPMNSAIAESAKGAKDWADAHFPSGGGFTGNNDLFYHALTDRSSVFFAGEKAFRDQLVEAHRGQEPSRKVDVNQSLPP